MKRKRDSMDGVLRRIIDDAEGGDERSVLRRHPSLTNIGRIIDDAEGGDERARTLLAALRDADGKEGGERGFLEARRESAVRPALAAKAWLAKRDRKALEERNRKRKALEERKREEERKRAQRKSRIRWTWWGVAVGSVLVLVYFLLR